MAPPTNGNRNALAPNKDRLRTLAGFMEGRKSYLAQILPKHLTPERVIKVAITAASRTPALLQCTPESFALAVIQASQLGLEAGSPLGEAYLVPYKTECTLIVGYRGYIALARRSGQIESIEARVVHARDRIRITYGLDAHLEHEPFLASPPDPQADAEAFEAWMAEADPGPVVAAYAIARLKGGMTQVEVMTRAEIEAIRRRSRASASGPWVTDFAEMARKTVVRRLAKYLPMSIELANAIEVDERGASPDLAEGLDVTSESAQGLPEPRPSATSVLASKLGQRVPATVARESGSDDGDDEPPMGPGGGGGPRGHYDAADADGGASEAGGSEGPQAVSRSWEPVLTSEGVVIEDEDAARRYLARHNEFRLMASYKRHAHVGWRALVVEAYARRRGCSVELARKALRASCSPSTVTATAPALRRTGTGG